ncbi:MAG: hypothetical protein AAFX99_15745, partial [Myxococcota bacterium]
WRISVERSAYERAMELLESDKHPGRIRGKDAFHVTQNSPWDWASIRLTENKACIFLEEDNSCYWHRHFGGETKGWVCRSYPNSAQILPDSTLVDGCLSCPPMAEALVDTYAGPMRLIDVGTDAFAAALLQPRFQVTAEHVIVFGHNRLIMADALELLIETLLEFLHIGGVSLGAQLLMGRLFLMRLAETTSETLLTRDHIQRQMAALESDATAIYLDAQEMLTPMNGSDALRAMLIRTFVFRANALGVASNRVPALGRVITQLHLNASETEAGQQLALLHRTWFEPTPHLAAALTAYGCHRLIKLQSLALGGVAAAYAEALFAMMLVWAYALADADMQGIAVNPDLLKAAMVEVEATFFHSASFRTFLKHEEEGGIASLYTVQTAALMTTPFVTLHHDPEAIQAMLPRGPEAGC